ncbi:hypothetical protein [Aliamphritea spongicola]|nr:hypothetical protein [Aliamphritea spongicola]
MADGVTKLEGKLKEAEDEYQKALEANQASAGAPAPAAPAFSQTQLDDLKADIEALQGKVESQSCLRKSSRFRQPSRTEDGRRCDQAGR